MAMVTVSQSFSFHGFFVRKASLLPSSASRVRYSINDRRWLNLDLASTSYRFRNLNSRCSITNTDLHLSSVVTEDEAPQDLLAAECDCSTPIVHLKTDILDSESLSLLAETTYVDSVLTALPVLSEEEQNALAATPAHPVGLYDWRSQSLSFTAQKMLFLCSTSLYASSLAGNLVEQLWNFAWPSSIALLHPSLLPVAVMGFFSKVVILQYLNWIPLFVASGILSNKQCVKQLAIIIGGPLLGKLMDYSPRVPAYMGLNVVQAAAQLLSATMIIHAHTVSSTSAPAVLFRPWFIVLVLAGAIERLCGVATGVAVERDWVILLAGMNRPIALAQANAVLNRIDLLCEIAGASVFGFLLSKYKPVTCLKYAAASMIWSLPVMIGLTWLTNKLATGVLDRPKSCQTSCGESPEEAVVEAGSIVDRGLETIKLGWKEYMQQPVLPASLAYVLLFFNVVLAPSSLMTAFLTQHGVNPSIIGGFSGLCAFMGVAATFLSATLVKQLGILKAGASGLVFQASLLSLAVAVYWSGSLSQQSPVLLFLGLIVLSRLGHMSYDVVGAQILQTGIPSSKVNLIGTTEVSVASLAESVMLGVAIIANDASHFGFLAMLSLLSVVGAAWMFCRLLLNPTDEQRSLFAVESNK
ncbi:hypothetical protein DKX38_006915 [Salix brachista]|uniref:Solute carrier family 40 member n=1 Tax=Salix brachista TaxID=2182728 RepID=A0A5N5MP95_9ROSI|nr:hypothetical protein DKX38_006915 [Salix brachista]